MSEKKKVKINGFVFTDEAEAEQAKKEAHGIHYVEERADMHHPETVLEIYNKMVKQSEQSDHISDCNINSYCH